MPEIGNQTTNPRVSAYEHLVSSCTIDPAHSTIGFSVRHAMISNVRGKFDSLKGLSNSTAPGPSCRRLT